MNKTLQNFISVLEQNDLELTTTKLKIHIKNLLMGKLTAGNLECNLICPEGKGTKFLINTREFNTH